MLAPACTSSFEVQRGLTGAQLSRYFNQEGSQWRAAPCLRALVTFKEFNLLDPLTTLGSFDLIFCRNVLIYFDAATKIRVVSALRRQMAPDAFLYLGASETTMGVAPDLTRAAVGCNVYQLPGSR